jgi:uncharacterized protein YceK
MMKRLFLLLSVLGTLVLSGCATVQMAQPHEDSKAKTFVTKNDRANIYIYRNELFGAAIQMDTVVNNKPLGKTGPKTFFMVDVPPGKHTVVSKAENDATLVVEAEAGKNYFIWQEVKMGLLFARSHLQLVDESKGKAGVNECSLIDSKVNF